MHPQPICARWLFALLLPWLHTTSGAEELTVRLSNAPERGALVFQVYDSADSFGGFRDPASSVTLSAVGDGDYQVPSPNAEQVALLVFHDANDNGVLDKNFIGIPREPIGISNNYRPKGPPSFDRAVFRARSPASGALEIEMFQILGRRGQVGVGLGVIARSSPYVESTESVSQIVPTIIYIGKRLQWFGPELSYGLLGSNKARLAVTASYRIGAYEEADSPRLAGLGDREDTLMLGLGFEYELPQGFELTLEYQHDALDRIGGGTASVELSRGFQWGNARLSPTVGFTWLSDEISQHDFGIPSVAPRPDRLQSYSPGSTTNAAVGLQGLFEVSKSWQAIVSVASEFLDSRAEDSPIVEDGSVLGGFAALTYVF